jgi:UDP-N-acetylglucosamine 2-epimerase (non-hydrolysing)
MIGNTMIDTLVAFEDKIEKDNVLEKLIPKHGEKKNEYALMTMHRPATVDFEEGLKKLMGVIDHITSLMPLVFPIHPRTMKKMETFNLLDQIKNNKKLILTEPLDYFAFQKLIACSTFVITDSGGIQEETTFRRVPCLTLRANTERPSTVDTGTNELIPFDIKIIDERIAAIRSGNFKKGEIPEKWDGKSTERILNICMEIFKIKGKVTQFDH